MYQIGNIYVISAIAIMGGGLFGFDISAMSAIIPGQSYKCYFNQAPFYDQGQCVGPSSSTQGGITAAMPGGSWLGALISGYLTDILGRRRAIQVGCLCWFLGSAISSGATSIGMLCAGRVINGLCVGIASAQVPVYITELAPPTKRGRLVGAQQWAITWGILIMFYISYGTSFLEGPQAFRIPWALQIIPALFLFAFLFIMPESPRWLARKGRWDEVSAVLTLVHGKGDPNSPLVTRELAEIREITELEASNADVTYWELLNAKNINRTHVGLFMQIWSQLTGMNVMMYYITYVFQMAGKSGNSLLLSSSIQYIINVIMTVPALLYMDRWGRRPTLLVGAALMAVWMFTNAGLLSTQGTYHGPEGFNGQAEAQYSVSGSAANALIASTYLFVASYAPTWGPVSWVYPPELYPIRTRGKAVALATSGNWAFNTALGAFVPPSFESIAWRTYVVFGVFEIAMFIHVFFLFPETAGKTIEQVQDIFEDPNGIKYIGTPAWKTHNGYKAARAFEKGQLAEDAEMGKGYSEKRERGDGSSEEDSSPTRHNDTVKV